MRYLVFFLALVVPVQAADNSFTGLQPELSMKWEFEQTYNGPSVLYYLTCSPECRKVASYFTTMKECSVTQAELLDPDGSHVLLSICERDTKEAKNH